MARRRGGGRSRSRNRRRGGVGSRRRGGIGSRRRGGIGSRRRGGIGSHRRGGIGSNRRGGIHSHSTLSARNRRRRRQQRRRRNRRFGASGGLGVYNTDDSAPKPVMVVRHNDGTSSTILNEDDVPMVQQFLTSLIVSVLGLIGLILNQSTDNNCEWVKTDMDYMEAIFTITGMICGCLAVICGGVSAVLVLDVRSRIDSFKYNLAASLLSVMTVIGITGWNTCLTSKGDKLGASPVLFLISSIGHALIAVLKVEDRFDGDIPEYGLPEEPEEQVNVAVVPAAGAMAGYNGGPAPYASGAYGPSAPGQAAPAHQVIEIVPSNQGNPGYQNQVAPAPMIQGNFQLSYHIA